MAFGDGPTFRITLDGGDSADLLGAVFSSSQQMFEPLRLAGLGAEDLADLAINIADKDQVVLNDASVPFLPYISSFLRHLMTFDADEESGVEVTFLKSAIACDGTVRCLLSIVHPDGKFLGPQFSRSGFILNNPVVLPCEFPIILEFNILVTTADTASGQFGLTFNCGYLPGPTAVGQEISRLLSGSNGNAKSFLGLRILGQLPDSYSATETLKIVGQAPAGDYECRAIVGLDDGSLALVEHEYKWSTICGETSTVFFAANAQAELDRIFVDADCEASVIDGLEFALHGSRFQALDENEGTRLFLEYLPDIRSYIERKFEALKQRPDLQLKVLKAWAPTNSDNGDFLDRADLLIAVVDHDGMQVSPITGNLMAHNEPGGLLLNAGLLFHRPSTVLERALFQASVTSGIMSSRWESLLLNCDTICLSANNYHAELACLVGSPSNSTFYPLLAQKVAEYLAVYIEDVPEMHSFKFASAKASEEGKAREIQILCSSGGSFYHFDLEFALNGGRLSLEDERPSGIKLVAVYQPR